MIPEPSTVVFASTAPPNITLDGCISQLEMNCIKDHGKACKEYCSCWKSLIADLREKRVASVGELRRAFFQHLSNNNPRANSQFRDLACKYYPVDAILLSIPHLNKLGTKMYRQLEWYLVPRTEDPESQRKLLQAMIDKQQADIEGKLRENIPRDKLEQLMKFASTKRDAEFIRLAGQWDLSKSAVLGTYGTNDFHRRQEKVLVGLEELTEVALETRNLIFNKTQQEFKEFFDKHNITVDGHTNDALFGPHATFETTSEALRLLAGAKLDGGAIETAGDSIYAGNGLENNFRKGIELIDEELDSEEVGSYDVGKEVEIEYDGNFVRTAICIGLI